MNISLQFVVAILIAHWVGDYLLQGNKIADQKSKSFRWLTLHVILYAMVLFFVSIYFFSMWAAIQYTFLNAGLHLITDFFTSKLSSKYKETPRIFYSIIGFDQLIHTVTLVVTYIVFT